MKKCYIDINGANAVQPYTPLFLSNQGHRTAPTRQYLYSFADWDQAPLSLDLGCGTGFITSELTSLTAYAHAIGIDIDPELLSIAWQNNYENPRLNWLLGDASTLPIRDAVSSFIISHFSLMWIQNYSNALAEAFRVLRSQAIFSAIEPDYSGRIEGSSNTQKESLHPIIRWLITKNANPFLGGVLPSELHGAGFIQITFGVLAWEFHETAAQAEMQEEAEILHAEGIEWTQPLFTYTPIFWLKARRE